LWRSLSQTSSENLRFQGHFERNFILDSWLINPLWLASEFKEAAKAFSDWNCDGAAGDEWIGDSRTM